MNNFIRPIAPFSLLKSGYITGEGISAPKEKAETNPFMTVSFEQALARALEPVNQLQQESAELDMKLASGQLDFLNQAVVAGEKASLALDLTIQVRNKVLEAYQEIMRTQL